MSPNLKANDNQQSNQGNGQPFFNPWGMFPSQPSTDQPDTGQKNQPVQQPNHSFNQPPRFQPQQPPNQQFQQPPNQQFQQPPNQQFQQPPNQQFQQPPNQQFQQPPNQQFQQPPNQQFQQPPRQQFQHPPKQRFHQPTKQPKQPPQSDSEQSFNPWHVFSGLRPMVPPDQQAPAEPNRPPKQQHEQAPGQMPFNPWSVLPAFGSQSSPEEEKPKKSPKNNGLTVQAIKEQIGKVIGTSIPGYGRTNVHIKGVNPNGMVHLVLLDTQSNDCIYIHNSDMVGIYPPTF